MTLKEFIENLQLRITNNELSENVPILKIGFSDGCAAPLPSNVIVIERSNGIEIGAN